MGEQLVGLPADPGGEVDWDLEWEPGSSSEGDVTFVAAFRTIHSASWLAVVDEVLQELGCGPDAVGEVLCELRPNGDFRIVESLRGRAVRGHHSGPGELDITRDIDIFVAARPSEATEAPSAPVSVARLSEVHAVERLRAQAAELGTFGSPGVDSDAALGILLEAVGAESAAVLIHVPRRRTLCFAAARGPRSAPLLSIEIPEDAGIAGLVRRRGASLTVHEVGQRQEHFGEVDAVTGYTTRAILAVPLIADGRVFGVLELLNPIGGAGFRAWHQRAANYVAEALTRALWVAPA
jgi:GAF domain-containing protein